MTDDESVPEIPIVCSECDTSSRIPLSSVADALEKHNERLHDGDDVAEVDPDVRAHVADLIAEELGLLE